MMRAFTSLAFCLISLFVVSCSSTPEKPRFASPADRRDTSHEAFAASEHYALSGDMWRSAALAKTAPQESWVELDLSTQRGLLWIQGELAMDFPICSGRKNSHETPKGRFCITQRSEKHRSTLYGDFVDAENGKVVRSGIRVTDSRPAGSVYRGQLLRYWQRFHGSIGLHEGDVYRKGSSHGCVRVPKEAAEILYEKLGRGSAVIVK